MFATLKAARWAIVAALLAAVTGGGAGMWYGWSERGEKEAVKAAAQLRKTVKIETDLGNELAALVAERFKTKEDLNRANQNYLAAVRAGAIRLSVPVASAMPGGATASAGHPQARAELEAEAAGRIVSITDDGDAAIISLNACIAQYEEVRKAVNGAQHGK